MTISWSWKKAMLWAWLIISGLYIIWSLWQTGLYAMYQAGMQAGTQNTIASVITKSQDCKPFNIYVDNAKADLINVACLQQKQADGTTPAAQPKK